MVTSELNPIIIVGAARSGTSILLRAIRDGAGVPGHHESHLFPLLKDLDEAVDMYGEKLKETRPVVIEAEGHVLYDWPLESIKDGIETLFIESISKLYDGMAWVEKTPNHEMIQAIPLVSEIFPNALFVFAKRRGIEIVSSRMRKYPNKTMEEHAGKWTRSMRAWLESREVLDKRRYIEIDQREIALRPKDVAQRLGRFLGLNEERIARVERVLTAQRPERTQIVEDYRYFGLDETGWSEQDKVVFKEVAGPMMEAYGYSLEGESVAVGAQRPIVLNFPIRSCWDGLVSLSNVADGRFWEISEGFVLHPNFPEKDPPSIRFHSIEFSGHNTFECSLSLGNEKSKPVAYRIEVVDPQDGNILFSNVVEVTAKEKIFWDDAFDPLIGRYDVLVSTSMANGASNDYAWAEWRSPKFQVF